MAYIGHSASGNFTTKPSKDTFSGDGSTTAFTLSEGATTNTVDVFVENVRQEPTTAYTVDGTTLTFTAAPGSGTNNIYVVNRGPLQLSATHPAAQALEASTGTFTGDLTVDTSTLKVDSTNNRVGVGTASPDTALHIIGSGVPSEINSSNSNAFKQEFSDNGTTRGFIGANSANAFMVGNSSGSTLFSIASSGILSIPNLPAFYARGTGTQSFSGTAAQQVVQFAGLVQVNNGSDFNTSTYKFTCPVAGIYCFFGSVTTTAAATGVEAFIVNETQSNFDIARVISYGDSYDQGVMIGIDDCAANDVISLKAINNNNTTFDLDLSRCNFGGVLLGAS